MCFALMLTAEVDVADSTFDWGCFMYLEFNMEKICTLCIFELVYISNILNLFCVISFLKNVQLKITSSVTLLGKQSLFCSY